MGYARPNRELAISMMSSAGLELFWAAIGLGAAFVALAGVAPFAMCATTAIAMAFALFAHSGAIAARWPRRGEVGESDAIGANVTGGMLALILGALALVGVREDVLAPMALLAVAGMLVLDAPIEPALAEPSGRAAGGFMVLAGLFAILFLVAAFSMRATGSQLVPWAALLIAAAQVVSAGAVLLRFVRR